MEEYESGLGYGQNNPNLKLKIIDKVILEC